MNILKKTLKKIHFTSDHGLVFCDKIEETKYIGERYHIQEKANKLKASAVLFRRKFENNKVIDSKPILYIFYNENNHLNINDTSHQKLHAKIWSAGDIDVYFIVSKTRIDIFNGRKPAEKVQDTQDLNIENLCLVSEALEKFNDQRFSALVFGKGVFWEQEDFLDNSKEKNFIYNQLREENTPFYQLLEYLMDVREYMHEHQKGFSNETIDKLLIICILVKFMEEIKDDNGKHTLNNIYEEHEVRDFADALDKGIGISILDDLAQEFNGQIFDRFGENEKNQIKQTDLELAADFLRANLDIKKGQYFLWKQYSFNYLPVELISSIYENFLPKEKGVVYTPPLLVNFLVDEVMPLDKAEEFFSEEKYRILDASCGSGIFLVATYRRMLQWWSVNQINKNSENIFPNKKVCQKILENNIFGIDINSTATLISIFSLTIALLDKLDPKEIWNDLKLNNLRDNIKTDNFFEWANKANNNDKKFDLVIGNPPFNPMSNLSKKEVVSDAQIQLFDLKNKDIPYGNFALKFFEGALFFGNKICMIIPSNILLYNRAKSTQKYRKRIFTKFTIEKIFDFTNLRRSLFGSVDTPVCAVLANPGESNRQKIEHLIIKRLTSIEKKIYFEIDHYDRHFVPHDWAIDETKQFVWKTNLLGGGRLFHLIYRLSLLEKLDEFIRRKYNNEWHFSVGYKTVQKIGKKIPADFITGNLTIKPKSFTPHGNFETIIETSERFVAPRPKELYDPPHIIIKLVAENSKIPIAFSDEYLCFNSSFVGIHAPQKHKQELYKIYNRIYKNDTTSNLYLAFVLATSSKTNVYHETSMIKEDIANLPYSEDIEYLIPSPVEIVLVNDVLHYYRHFGKSLKKNDDGYCLQENVSRKKLMNYGKIFCDTLNSIYAKDDKSWQYGKFFQSQSFTIYQLGFGKNRGLTFQQFDENEFDKIVNSLIYNNTINRAAIFTRICRIYKHLNGYDCVFLIKPNALRYWLESIALRDADETFMDLKQAGR